MNSKLQILEKLNHQYFWDIDFSESDDATSSRLIIERVYSLGEIHEMNQVIQFYGENHVIDVLSSLPYIDSKTLTFISKLFNKPLKEFRCYKRKLSKSQHWI